MRNYKKTLLLTLLWILWLASCTLPQNTPAVSYAKAPTAWIDAPLDGSHLPLGGVEIITHASAPKEVAAVQLQVNQQQVAERPPDKITNGLALTNFLWQATAPGEYLLTVAAQDADGTWGPFSSAAIIVGEVVGSAAEVQETLTVTPTVTAAPTSTPEEDAGCINRAGYISETIPDDTQFLPGENFTKSWTLVNNGTCIWESGYSLVFVDGSGMGGPSSVALPEVVPPGDQVTLLINLQAPGEAGTYQGNWMLADQNGEVFGLGESGQSSIWVRIEVAIEIVIIPGIILDTQPPTIAVDYSPKGGGGPTESQEITFTASGTDNVGITLIEIYFTLSGEETATLVGTCSDTSFCEITGGPYSADTYVLIAKAFDAAGNQSSTWPQDVIVFEVVH
jgi:hypothetical protein